MYSVINWEVSDTRLTFEQHDCSGHIFCVDQIMLGQIFAYLLIVY